ncbi:MAG TPA: transglycosylase domain-containing protein [Polyangiaceae bacterium]|nr:transglycosylase domain-containing protein [Polyangiaceae bacterium]
MSFPVDPPPPPPNRAPDPSFHGRGHLPSGPGGGSQPSFHGQGSHPSAPGGGSQPSFHGQGSHPSAPGGGSQPSFHGRGSHPSAHGGGPQPSFHGRGSHPSAPALPPGPPPKQGFLDRLAQMRWQRVAKAAAVALAFAAALAFVAGWALLSWVERQLPDVHELRGSYKPPQVTRVLARDGSPLAELFTERRTVIQLEGWPREKNYVWRAFLAAEDADFFGHAGLNYVGMLRALAVNLRSGRTRQGGSTITQQVIKNVLLDPERTYKRKLKEAVLARRLEQELTKTEILELYLNHIYMGAGRYGIEEAAKYYFGKSAIDLTPAEAVTLATLPAGPETFSPRKNLEKHQARRAFVLDQMKRKGFFDPPELAREAEAVPKLADPDPGPTGLGPEVVEIAKKTLRELVGEEAARAGGYTVHTTIDPKLQKAARDAVRQNLQSLDKRLKAQAPLRAPAPNAQKQKGGKKGAAPPGDRPFEGTPKPNEIYRALVGVVTGAHDDTGLLDVRVGDVAGTVKLADFERYNPQKLPPSAFAEPGSLVRVSFFGPPPAPGPDGSRPPVPLRLELGPQSALVALDARSRDVLALVGSFEGVPGGLDRATQSRRQPGSTFKPILYSYALHSRKITAATLVDAGVSVQEAYKNVNAEDGNSREPVRLREAVARSINPVALQVMRTVGPENVVPWAQSLGIASKLGKDLSLALGAYEVTPLEMAGAYATFAAGGVYEAPRLITRVVGPDGREVRLPSRPEPRRVLDEAEAYLVTDLLSSVVNHPKGTGGKARELGRPVVGKTGTTNQAKDAWFVGYSPDVVCAVWTGYDDPRPLGGGREAGASAALPAWVTFMKSALAGRPATDFPRPPGLSITKIDPETGKLASEGQEDALDELFLPGTEPTETADPVGVLGAGLSFESLPEPPAHAPEPAYDPVPHAAPPP